MDGEMIEEKYGKRKMEVSLHVQSVFFKLKLVLTAFSGEVGISHRNWWPESSMKE